ncbi:leucine-rich repeat-containing protein 38-like [Pocillopora verrucosa]|uniref:leucine-rich repeat-containing protein 38-like n=1 Tax=Pocillopora verrucosa TaxID=203993 RepID=UPI003340CE08
MDQAPNPQYVFLNRTSNLWCPVKGAPAPYIVWRKDGVTVQKSTSITFQLKITSENNVNYTCEVRRDGEVLKRNISLKLKECPDPCECNVFHQTIVSVNCSGKSRNSIPWKFPRATSKLYLSSNELRDLPHGIFSNYTQLEFLEMSNNLFRKLSSGIFSNNTELSFLLLGNNRLKKLPSGIFNNNIQLTFLSVKNNHLEDLPNAIFTNNINLIEL